MHLVINLLPQEMENTIPSCEVWLMPFSQIVTSGTAGDVTFTNSLDSRIDSSANTLDCCCSYCAEKEP